jgi:thioredoxin reductase (NADPH)
MDDSYRYNQDALARLFGEYYPHEWETNVGAARLAMTDDPEAAPTTQRAVIQQPPVPEAMPKQGMNLAAALPVDALHDVTVVGGGPAGLFAAFYAGMREMSVKIVDSLPDLGGQISALYPEKHIYDVGGFPQILGKELVAGCVTQGLQFGATVCLGERVQQLRREEDGTFTLGTDKQEHRTRTVIIAAGVGAFAPRKLNEVSEFDALEGTSIFYYVRDPRQFQGRRLLIVGGGDSALDWALMLEPIAERVTLAHRRDRFRAHEETVRKVTESSVDLKTFHEIRRIHAEDGRLQAVTIYDNRTQDEQTLPVDAVILALGFIANIGPIREWGITIVDGGVAVDTRMATNIPGVFAAGDITRYQGKLNLIATGFGEAAIAANYCKNFIDPQSRVFPGHSSEKSG